jgi:hypothetical protein
MKRHPQLVLLSWDHHHGLVLALRIGREVTGANAVSLARLYADLLASWDAHLLPHFRVEQECLLARLVRYVPKATMRDTTDPELRRDSIHRFGETLRAHIRWEEEVLFEVTQRQLDENELTALGREIAERLPDVSHQASVSSLQVANEYDVDGSPLAG